MQGWIHANNSTISGMNKCVKGNNNTVSGMNCKVHGNNNVVSGMSAYVEGNNNTVSGMGAFVHGDNNTVSGMNSSANGKNNIVNGMGSTNNGKAVVRDRAQDNYSSFVFSDGNVSVIQGDGITTVNGVRMVFNNNGEDKKKKKNKKKKEKELSFVEGPSPSEEKDDVTLPNDTDDGCVVCLTNKKNCIVLPCKHLSLCVKCSLDHCSGQNRDELKKINEVKCPVCRTDVVSIGKVFQ
jgi:hypothetical protein